MNRSGGGELIVEKELKRQTKTKSVPIPDSSSDEEKSEITKIEKKPRKKRVTIEDGSKKERVPVGNNEFRCNKCRSNQSASNVRKEQVIQKSGRKQAILKGCCSKCGTNVSKFVKNE